ncbi:MAG: dihydrofolate reductase [Oscillospiraceae bacterium]|nr:dihydrofolate reductase [Oscillospiraceae bacterium]
MKMIFSADNNWGIGCGNKLLFHAKGDMAYFKKMTTGKVVIMGRKTLESLPNKRPLPNRVNIVLTSDESYATEGAIICHSLEALFETVKIYDRDDLFVIGGAEVYRLLMPYCDAAYITRFFADAPADRFMSDFDALPDWERVSSSDEMHENGVSYRFDMYIQQSPGKCGGKV